MKSGWRIHYRSTTQRRTIFFDIDITNMTDTFDIKFGAMPATIQPEKRMIIVYAIQFVVCVLILTALRPPFVLSVDDELSSSSLSLFNTCLVSIITVGITAVLVQKNVLHP